MLGRRGFLVFAGAAGLAGCASPNPNLYAIATVPGVAQGGAPRVIVLRGVGLPAIWSARRSSSRPSSIG